MTRDEVTGSKNYSAKDLAGGDVVLVIAEVTQEEFKAEDGYRQKKLVVQFRGKDKRLVCGKTKANELFDMLGDDTEEWIGQRIALGVGKTNFQGKRVDCVVVKPAPAPARRPARAEVDDEPEAVAPAARPRRAAVAEEPLDDDTPF